MTVEGRARGRGRREDNGARARGDGMVVEPSSPAASAPARQVRRRALDVLLTPVHASSQSCPRSEREKEREMERQWVDSWQRRELTRTLNVEHARWRSIWEYSAPHDGSSRQGPWLD